MKGEAERFKVCVRSYECSIHNVSIHTNILQMCVQPDDLKENKPLMKVCYIRQDLSSGIPAVAIGGGSH